MGSYPETGLGEGAGGGIVRRMGRVAVAGVLTLAYS